MSNEQALLDCTFGWGKTCHLYADSLEVAGKTYRLKELTAIRPTYRTILGVSSARIELSFGLQHLVLRGIPDQETARLMVAHLQPYCQPMSIARARLRAGKARSAAREQARTWERSSRLPALPRSLTGRAGVREAPGATAGSAAPSFNERAPGSLQGGAASGASPRAASLEPACDPLLAVRADGWPLAHARRLHTPRFQPPLRSVRLVSPDQKVQDTCSLPVPALRSNVLPVIHVPVRLQPGECAHYSIGASLCSDRISGSDRAPYPPLDHGLLILTNRRIFYLGKRSQLILAYTHLWYVSLLHNAIALHIEQQFRRIIIELEHPQEWASRIEQLSFIARRTHPRPDLPTLLMVALPGLSASSLHAATLKRPTLKSPLSQPREQPVVEATGPIREESDQAPASALVEEAGWDYAAVNTLDLPALPEQTGGARPESLFAVEVQTQELPRTGDLADVATQEFGPSKEVEDIATLHLRPPTAAREEGEVTTSPLSDARVADPWLQEEHAEVNTLPLLAQTTDALASAEEQTLSLHDGRLACGGGRAQQGPADGGFPECELTPRCLSQAREARRPSYRQEQS